MKLLVLLYVLQTFSALELYPEKQEIEYLNNKYVKFMSITFRKYGHNSPHYVNLDLETYVGVGNNLTVKLVLFEFLGGHYIPTPIYGEYKLCDFLNKEPFFGQMYAKQLPANWTCPFPAGEYHFNNITIHLENFPHNIPFTYSSLIVRTRSDVHGFLTSTKEEIFRWKTYVRISQKLQKKDSKKNT